MPPSRRCVDADALWTHYTATDVTQHVGTCELRRCAHTAFGQAQETIPHFHSHLVCSLCLTIDQRATWWRSGSVVVPDESTSGRGGERSDARLSAVADLQSSRAQVTPTGVLPTVDHTALADSVARAVCCCGHSRRHEQNLWTVVLSRSRTSSGRSERAGTTGQQYYRTTHRMRMLTCTPR